MAFCFSRKSGKGLMERCYTRHARSQVEKLCRSCADSPYIRLISRYPLQTPPKRAPRPCSAPSLGGGRRHLTPTDGFFGRTAETAGVTNSPQVDSNLINSVFARYSPKGTHDRQIRRLDTPPTRGEDPQNVQALPKIVSKAWLDRSADRPVRPSSYSRGTVRSGDSA